MRENRRDPKRSEKEDKLKFSERMCRALDIEPDVLLGSSLIEIRGRGAVTIGGGGRILDYTDEEIRIALKKGAVVINGKHLVCASFCAGKVRIEGRIKSVKFEEFSNAPKRNFDNGGH